jgi:flagellar hook-associated protein 3 FlgL
MRVANNSIFNAVANNVMRNQERFLKLEEAISYGKRLDKLSTDPPAVGQMLRFRTTAASLEQYQRNIDQGNSWLNVTEVSLAQAGDVLMRAKELTLSQTTGTADTDSHKAAAVEINGFLQQAIRAGNAKVGNQFLFAGRKTNAAPFSSTGTYQGDSGTIDFEIDEGAFVTVNTLDDVIFKGAQDGVDILNALQSLQTALQANDQAGIQAQLNPLDQSLNRVLNARADVGAEMNRLDAQKGRLTEVSDQLTQTLGEAEGTDLAKAISGLTQQQFVYQASLAASAKMVQLTLLDFLR